jgi:hypothetical protein
MTGRLGARTEDPKIFTTEDTEYTEERHRGKARKDKILGYFDNKAATESLNSAVKRNSKANQELRVGLHPLIRTPTTFEAELKEPLWRFLCVLCVSVVKGLSFPNRTVGIFRALVTLVTRTRAVGHSSLSLAE